MDNADVSRIPGVNRRPTREYLYFAMSDAKQFRRIFHRLTNAAPEPKANSGGVVEERFEISTPDGKKFYGTSYQGDLAGWKSDLVAGASLLNMEVAEIIEKDGRVVLSTSEEKIYPLVECEARDV